MAKSPIQTLLAEIPASLAAGRRTVEFEDALLAFFPEGDRELIREALSQRPAFSASVVRLAHAARAVIDGKNQFEDDEEAVQYFADIRGVHADTLRRAAVEKRNSEVNQLLREWELLPKTKG